MMDLVMHTIYTYIKEQPLNTGKVRGGGLAYLVDGSKKITTPLHPEKNNPMPP